MGIWPNADYFNHSTLWKGNGYEMRWDNEDVCNRHCSQAADYGGGGGGGVYSTKVFTDQAIEVMDEHDA